MKVEVLVTVSLLLTRKCNREGRREPGHVMMLVDATPFSASYGNKEREVVSIPNVYHYVIVYLTTSCIL